MLDALSLHQQCPVDPQALDSPPYSGHGSADGRKERSAGVLHQMPTVGHGYERAARLPTHRANGVFAPGMSNDRDCVLGSRDTLNDKTGGINDETRKLGAMMLVPLSKQHHSAKLHRD